MQHKTFNSLIFGGVIFLTILQATNGSHAKTTASTKSLNLDNANHHQTTEHKASTKAYSDSSSIQSSVLPSTSATAKSTIATTKPATTNFTNPISTNIKNNGSELASTPVPIPQTVTGTGGFDGASFFGGFVLAIGLGVIGLVIYKVCFNNRATGPSYSQF